MDKNAKDAIFYTEYNPTEESSTETVLDIDMNDQPVEKLVMKIFQDYTMQFYGPDGATILTIGPTERMKSAEVHTILDNAWGVIGFGRAAQTAYVESMGKIKEIIAAQLSEEQTDVAETPRTLQ